MKSVKQMPGYAVYEYLLVLNPHEELRDKIIGVQKKFQEKYKTEAYLSPRPNVPLVKFTQYEVVEDRLIDKLKRVSLGAKPIKIEIDGYGSFPSHTIFLNVTTKSPIQNLIKEIRTETQRLMKLDDDNKPQFFLEPYMPIARKLKPWQYEGGWEDYQHRHFTGKFIADRMLLLKRQKGAMKYQIAETFMLENMFIPTATQGNLF